MPADILLGFDYGSKRIGIAVGQRITGTANELATLENINNKPDWDSIGRLIAEWKPAGLIVGKPLNMDGSEQEMTKKAARFGRQLAERYHLPVNEMDERLSSHAAHDILKQSGKDEQQVDSLAARLILESWMNEN